MKPYHYLVVRDLLKTEMKIGIPDMDFMLDMHTIQFKIKFKHLAYIYRIKISDVIEDEPFILTFKNKIEKEVAHRIWRLNDKRVRHGLESWI